MTICQLLLHKVDTAIKDSDSTIFFGKSRPVLGTISLDKIAKLLAGFGNSNK